MRHLLLTVAMLATLATVVSQTFSLPLRHDDTPSVPSHQKKLIQAESIIENYYVDDVAGDSIVEAAIVAMLKTLDPHSSYTSAEETRALEEPLQGNFSGIGISFNNTEDTIIVLSTVAGGPAEQVGMLSGDRILQVNDTTVSGVKMSTTDIKKRIRGPKGSQVKISARRGSEPIDFVITRDDIPIYSIDAAYMVNDSTGYIRLARFAESTPDEIDAALDRLRARGMRHIVIDLLDNGGGYMTAATDLANRFLHSGDMIVSTRGNNVQPRYYEAYLDGELADGGRLVVMVNQNSASASEIFAGAIQDNDRGAVVGRRSFGKGLVQRPFRFADGSMIRLTISRYYTPSGRSIQKPYTAGHTEEYSLDLSRRLTSGELTDSTALQGDSTKLYFTRGHRPVYGGGGVTPDVWVPLDTTYFTPYLRALTAKSVIAGYTVAYFDSHRGELRRLYPTEQSFIDGFEVTVPMLDDILARAEKAGIEPNPDQWLQSLPWIKAVVKGIIGRDLFDPDTYYKVVNPLNPIFIEAIDLIADPERYGSLLQPR